MGERSEKDNRTLQPSLLAKTEEKFSEILPAILLSLPIIVRFVFLDVTAIGNDTMIHIYKSYVLREQLSHLPPYLWGLWDWSWRAGYPFLQTYAPMFYYAVASLSLLFSLPLEITAKTILLLSFPISAISMHLLAFYLTRDKIASLVATAGYLYIPYYVANLSINGSTGSVLAFMFMPLALLFAEKTMNTRDRKYILLSSLCLMATLLSNHLFGFVTTIVVFCWMVLKGKTLQSFFLVFMTGLLSFFWLYPFLFTLKTNPPVTFERDIGNAIYEIMHPGNQGIGFFVFAIAFLSIITWFKNRRKLDKYLEVFIHLKKTFLVCGILLIGIGIYNMVGFFFTMAPFDLLLFYRTMPAISLLLPLILMFPLFIVKRRKLVAAAIIVVLVVESLFLFTYYPLGPSQYATVFEYLKSDLEWFRVLFIPREPIGTLIPLYSGKPVIDGWADHELDVGNLIHDIADYTEYGASGQREPDIIQNPDKALSVLGYLGVKYVVVDASDPIPGYELSFKFYEALNSSSIAEEVFSSGWIRAFKIKNFKPIIASTKINVVANLEEFYELVGSDNRDHIFFYETQKPIDLHFSQGEDEIELIDYQIYQSIERFQVVINTTASTQKPFYLLIPITHTPDLSVTINEQQVTPLTSVPGFIVVKLEGEGIHKISVSVKLKSANVLGIIVSIIAIPLFLTGGLIGDRIKALRRKRRIT